MLNQAENLKLLAPPSSCDDHDFLSSPRALCLFSQELREPVGLSSQFLWAAWSVCGQPKVHGYWIFLCSLFHSPASSPWTGQFSKDFFPPLTWVHHSLAKARPCLSVSELAYFFPPNFSCTEAVRGSRVYQPRIYFLGYWLFLSWLLRTWKKEPSTLSLICLKNSDRQSCLKRDIPLAS